MNAEERKGNSPCHRSESVPPIYPKDRRPKCKLLIWLQIFGMADGVADGTRTHDNRNHNPGLYQLSYSHHWSAKL